MPRVLALIGISTFFPDGSVYEMLAPRHGAWSTLSPLMCLRLMDSVTSTGSSESKNAVVRTFFGAASAEACDASAACAESAGAAATDATTSGARKRSLEYAIKTHLWGPIIIERSVALRHRENRPSRPSLGPRRGPPGRPE